LFKYPCVYPSIHSWGTLGDAEDILEAAEITTDDTMWIGAGAFILHSRFKEKKR